MVNYYIFILVSTVKGLKLSCSLVSSLPELPLQGPIDITYIVK